MASDGKVLGVFYIYLLLSIDPINASRIKTAGRVIAKTQETDNLVKELKKALQSNHMNELFVQNASHFYIGETWASCAGRKADFERRSEKVKARYEEAISDGTISTIESGWVILKVRSLAMTVSTAAKQGCEWVHDQSSNMTALEGLINETNKNVPCRDAAMASLEDAKKAGREPTQDELANAFSVIFSDAKDCKPHDVKHVSKGAAEVFAAEEKGEHDAQDIAKQFEENRKSEQSLAQQMQKQGSSQALTALLQKVSQQTQSSLVVTVSGIIGIMISLVLAILMCTVALILWVFILGMVWCLFKAIIAKLLEVLDQDSYDTDFVECADDWIDYVKRRDDDEADLLDVSAALCILTSLAGHPIAGFYNGGLYLNVPNVHTPYHHNPYSPWWY
jgi:hypothetical protein